MSGKMGLEVIRVGNETSPGLVQRWFIVAKVSKTPDSGNLREVVSNGACQFPARAIVLVNSPKKMQCR